MKRVCQLENSKIMKMRSILIYHTAKSTIASIVNALNGERDEEFTIEMDPGTFEKDKLIFDCRHRA